MQLNVDNLPSVLVFLYNIQKGVGCCVTDAPDATSLKTLTPLVNATALNNDYLVDEELKTLSTIQTSLSVQDFGITILMLNFAKFYSQDQYPLYVHTFRCLKELEIIEQFLLAYNKNHIKLPPNMASDAHYGLKCQAEQFTNSKYLTVEAFHAIVSYMKCADITPGKFISVISQLHINIIESFYMFMSITKNCKVINECHDLINKSMNYTFQKPIKSLRYDGDYWFVLPNKAIWFAYFQNQVKFSSYISHDAKKLMSAFKTVTCIVVGFIHENQLFPIIFEDPNIHCRWDKIIEYILYLGLNCSFKRGQPTQKRVYFVKNNVSAIFKLEK